MKETRFKDTEIGRIPEDWEVTLIGNECSVNTGSRNTQDKIDDGQFPFYVRSQEIERINTYSYDCEAVLTAGDGVGTGKVFHYVNGKFEVHQRVYIMNEFSSRLDGRYLYRFFSLNFYNRIHQMTAKSSVDSVRKEMITKMPLVLPPVSEQSRIASALTSIDNLIASLDKLIEKKKNIKQGTMQQLLTGKKRMKGFTEPWVEKKLGDILDYEQPTKYIVHSTDYSNSGVPVLTAGKTFILGYTSETFGLYDNTPVIIFDDFVTESKYVTFPFKVKSSAIKILSLRDNSCNLRFVYEIMQMIDFPMTDHKRYWIGQYSQLPVMIPRLCEQNAITSVLASMDNDISALESQKTKYESIKKGMMQQLLSGKIRLIKHS